MRSSVGTGAFAIALLACHGASAGPDAAVSVLATPSPPSPPPPSAPPDVVVQTLDGLFTGDGTFLADLGGGGVVRDVYVVPATRSRIFLFRGDKDEVRIATRSADGWTASVVATGDILIRPLGDAAVVGRDKAGALRVIDGSGETLLDDLSWPRFRKSLPPLDAPDISQPTYWWSPTYDEVPAPLCHRSADGSPDLDRCGWVTSQGRWLNGDAWSRVEEFVGGWAGASRDGQFFWVGTDGKVREPPLDSSHEVTGPIGDSPVIIRDEEGYLTLVATDGTTVPLPTEIVLMSEDHPCTERSGFCTIAFYDGLAAVHTANGSTGWIGVDGTWAVPPVRCGAPGPIEHVVSVPAGPFHEGRAFRCEGVEVWMVDTQGAHVGGPWKPWEIDSPNGYPNGLFFSEGLAAVPGADGSSWSYVDLQGKVVLAGPYDVARPFRAGFALVKEGSDVHYIARDGSRRFDPPAP